MAPEVPFTAVATPVLPLPATSSAGQFEVSPAVSVNTPGAAAVSHFVKLEVVPEASERWTGAILVDGRLTMGLRALMAGSFQVLMCAWKILATVGPSSTSLSTPDTL